MSAAPHSRKWVIWCLAVYAGAVALLLLTPVSYASVVNLVGDWFRFGLGLSAFGSGWLEFLANILMFVPLGFLLTLLFAHPWHGVVLALVLSAGAELAQFVIPSRQPSLRDVLANVSGATIGAAIAWLLVLRRRRRTAAEALTWSEDPA